MSPRVRLDMNSGAFESRTEAHALRMLNIRIATLTVILMVELWGLTSALEAWAEGRSETLILMMGLQCVAFVLALATWLVSVRRGTVRRTLAAISTREPAVAE